MTALTVASWVVSLYWLHKGHLRSFLKIQIPRCHTRCSLWWRQDMGKSSSYSVSFLGVSTPLQGITSHESTETLKVHSFNYPCVCSDPRKSKFDPQRLFCFLTALEEAVPSFPKTSLFSGFWILPRPAEICTRLQGDAADKLPSEAFQTPTDTAPSMFPNCWKGDWEFSFRVHQIPEASRSFPGLARTYSLGRGQT